MIEIQLNSFPKHKVKLYDGELLRDVVEVNDGLEAFREATRLDNPFEDIRQAKMLSKACELFKPIKIRIKDDSTRIK